MINKYSLEQFYSKINLHDFQFPKSSQIRKKISQGFIDDLDIYFSDSLENNYNFLDLGCGAGINSLYANLKGFNVYSLDKKNIISKLYFISKFYSDKINLNYIITNDFPNYKFDINFDFILNMAYLHVLDSKNKQFENLEKMIETTNFNGINLISTFVNDNGLDINNKNIFSLISSKDIFSIYKYKKWKIIRSGFNWKNKHNYILVAKNIGVDK